MKRLLFALFLLATCRPTSIAMAAEAGASPAADGPATVMQPVRPAPAAVLLDGRGTDPVWAKALSFSAPAAGKACALQVVSLPGVLLIGVDVPEEGGAVAREILHGGPLWGDDYVSIECSGSRKLFVSGNALGTLLLTLDGKDTPGPVQKQDVVSAALLTEKGWRLEVAIRTDGLLDSATPVTCLVKRERQSRRYEPSQTAAFPELKLALAKADAAPVAVRTAPTQVFVPPRVLKVAAMDALPADEAAWSAIPAVPLYPERGLPVTSAEFQETRVRAALTPTEIGFRIDCLEAFPDSIGEFDKEAWRGDSIELSLGPERFPYPVFIITPSGKMEAMGVRSGRGKPRSSALPKGAFIKTVRLPAGGWSATLTVPLQSVIELAGGGQQLLPANHAWHFQLIRNRPEREALGQAVQTSLFAITRSDNSHCPARFAALQAVKPAALVAEALPGRATVLPPPVLDAAAKATIHPGSMLEKALQARTRECQVRCDETFRHISDKAGWEAYAAAQREKLLRCLFPADGGTPPKREAMHADIVFEEKGEGFSYVGVIFETFPGLRAPGVLYLPANAKAGAKLPVLIMLPAHHTPSDAAQLQILGANFARNGGIALAVSAIGTGERGIVDYAEHQTYQRHHFGVQLQVAGEEISGWTAFEMSRAVDYLLTRDDVDPARIALVGAVAGGGDLASAAAALDPRIAISIPFNFSSTALSGSNYDFMRAIPGSHPAGLSAWVMDALVAPRKYIHSQEFQWTDGAQKGQERFEKVYAWLGVPRNLASQHGWVHGDVTHFGQFHRIQMYGIFLEWFNMGGMNVANQLEYTTTIARDRLTCLGSPKGAAVLARAKAAGQLREPLEVAREIAAKRLADARAASGGKPVVAKEAFCKALKNVKPDLGVTARLDLSTPPNMWETYPVRGVWYNYSDATRGEVAGGNAVWWFTPAAAAPANGYPLAVGICRAGKARLLAERGADVKALLAAGISVALADLSDCGELDSGSSRYPRDTIGDLASHALLLDDSMAAIWVRETRALLRQLAQSKTIDASRIGLWGEGFSAANGKNKDPFLLEEIQFFQSTPEPKNLVEPMGELTCLFAALLDNGAEASAGKAMGVRAVLLRGGMSTFFSALEDRNYYFPQDSYLPGMLAAGDLPDVIAALQQSKVAVIAEDIRDAKNRVLDPEFLKKEWGAATPAAYSMSPSAKATQEFIRRMTE